MAQLLGWAIVIGLVVAISAVWLRFYPSGHKWPVWFLWVVIATVGFALFGGVAYGFDRGTVTSWAVTGVAAGVTSLICMEWKSVKRLLKRLVQ